MVRKSKWETTKRIETLVDGIFAIAMTLLVLSLTVPVLTGPVSDATMTSVLLGLWPKFIVYGFSFILLAIFWSANHAQFYHIIRIDKTLLWITLIWLLFVALVPFSASLNGEYGNLKSASVFFGLNMFFIGILLFLIWYYATQKNLIKDDLSLEDVKSIRKINLALPIASVISIGLAFVIPSWSYLAYFLIPVIHNIIEKDHWRK